MIHISINSLAICVCSVAILLLVRDVSLNRQRIEELEREQNRRDEGPAAEAERMYRTPWPPPR